MAPNISEVSQILDLVEGIIVVVDADQRVSYINRKGCELLGYEKGNILGKNWFDNFLPERIRKDIKAVYSKLMDGEIELAEYFDNVVLTKSGQERIIGWHNIVLKNVAGSIVGTLSLGEDITERGRLVSPHEQRIQELEDRLSELMSKKMHIPICSWDKKDMKKAINDHYRLISTAGNCSECLRILRTAPKI
jgi:PAS domain S-box-containing protein